MNSIEMPALKKTKNFTENILDESDKRTGCIIMASGLGKRFGGNKLVADFGGKPLINWILDSSQNIFDELVVVTRSNDVKEICDKNHIQVILHSEPGRNDTVRLGLSSIMDKTDHCLFMPADQPLISRETLQLLVKKTKEESGFIWRAGYKDQVGSPVSFPKWTYDELLNLPEGKGGNIVVKQHMDKVKIIQVKYEYELQDIDTREDLDSLSQKIKMTNML